MEAFSGVPAIVSMGYHANTIQANEREDTIPRAPFLKAYVEQGYNVNWILTGKGKMKLEGV